MEDATSVLFDLPGFVVIECVELSDDDARRVVIMQVIDKPRRAVKRLFTFPMTSIWSAHVRVSASSSATRWRRN